MFICESESSFPLENEGEDAQIWNKRSNRSLTIDAPLHWKILHFKKDGCRKQDHS